MCRSSQAHQGIIADVVNCCVKFCLTTEVKMSAGGFYEAQGVNPWMAQAVW
jgi:hypothetical protein